MRRQIKLSVSHKSGNTTVSRAGVVEIEKEGREARVSYDTFEAMMWQMDDESLSFVVTVSFQPLVRAMVMVDADLTEVMDVSVADFSTINDKGEVRCEPATDYECIISDPSTHENPFFNFQTR